VSDNFLKKRKDINKYFLFIVLICCSLIFSLGLGYYLPNKWQLIAQQNCNYKICLHDTGIHTNFIVPVKNNIFDWNEHLNIQNVGKDEVNSYEYLIFGWGDRDFMINVPTFADFNLALTLKALFLPTPSTIYIQGYQEIPTNLTIKCIEIDGNNYLKLMNLIENTFKLNSKREKIRIANGHYNNAGFYDAKGSYTVFRNCNDWVGEGLDRANVNTPLWSGLSSGIMRHLKTSCHNE
jgi:uncharacterized protein (TIGR02117 family)